MLKYATLYLTNLTIIVIIFVHTLKQINYLYNSLRMREVSEYILKLCTTIGRNNMYYKSCKYVLNIRFGEKRGMYWFYHVLFYFF